MITWNSGVSEEVAGESEIFLQTEISVGEVSLTKGDLRTAGQ